MSRPRKVPYVRNRLFRGIPRELLDLDRLVRRRCSYEPGKIVFDEGDEPDYCYLVASGSVRITKALADGHEELLAIIRPGDFFGELALYDSNRRSARATAAEQTRLGLLDQRSFDYLRGVAPLQMASTLAECGIERVRQTNLLLVSELGVAGRMSQVGHELSTLSHNLRSPLSTIHSAADLLRRWITTEGRDPTQTVHFIEIIQRTAESGLAQIEQLMARLRGDAARVLEELSVEGLLEELRELTTGLMRGPGVHYRDDELRYRGSVVADRRELLAVLCNLVKNAAEALPPKGGTVSVRVAEEDGMVVFTVSDTGAGIPAENLPRLFDRGFTAGKVGGTGLGLSHAKRVVEEQFGGKISVTSTVGSGTTVLVCLPLPPRRGTGEGVMDLPS